MNLITALKLRNRTAPSALDVICSTETIREILDAMTAKQLVVAALLIRGWTLQEIANELSTDERPVTWQAVAHRRRAAQERVARTMIHVNAEHLAGDVMARQFWKKERRNRIVPLCADCGCPIYKRSIRCQPCAQIERRRKERAA